MVSITCIGCQENTKPKSISSDKTPASLTLDLEDLQRAGKLKNTQLILVNNDPVYQQTKRYHAIPLLALLKTHTALEKLEVEKYQVVYECKDGYKPVMRLEQLLAVKSFVAVSDAGAPKGSLWSPLIKNGQEISLAPFYLIYEGVSVNQTAYKWPYQLIKIHLEAIEKATILQKPKASAKVQRGYDLFQKHCLVCHAVNKIGGRMGPELNYPKSVTEYWKIASLKAFIQNPAAFRSGVKMPQIKTLTAKDIDAIVDYLSYMADHPL